MNASSKQFPTSKKRFSGLASKGTMAFLAAATIVSNGSETVSAANPASYSVANTCTADASAISSHASGIVNGHYSATPAADVNSITCTSHSSSGSGSGSGSGNGGWC